MSQSSSSSSGDGDLGFDVAAHAERVRPAHDRVVKSVRPPADPPLSVSELYGPDNKPRWRLLRHHLKCEGRIQIEAASALINDARNVMLEEENLLELEAPITIVGDLHGQFYDFLSALDIIGPPPHTRYLFLGDYVDRGIWSTEIVLLLLALKVCYPKRVFMLRGNHETRAMAEFHNFHSEVSYKYDEHTYEEFMECFDTLPLAALVVGPSARFLCMHGGLSPDITTLEDINKIFRFTEVPASGPLCDLVWADPISEETAEGLDAATLEQWNNIDFVRNDLRGCSFIFGVKAIRTFLRTNGLDGIIRAHEVQEDGYCLHHYGDTSRRFPLVTTLFSAPNYCDRYENRAAILHFDGDNCEFIDYDCAPHPFGLPDYMDAFSWSFPFVIEKTTQLFFAFINLASALNDEEDDSDSELEDVGLDGDDSYTTDDVGSTATSEDVQPPWSDGSEANQQEGGAGSGDGQDGSTSSAAAGAEDEVPAVGAEPGQSGDQPPPKPPKNLKPGRGLRKRSTVISRSKGDRGGGRMRRRAKSAIISESFRTRKASLSGAAAAARRVRERASRSQNRLSQDLEAPSDVRAPTVAAPVDPTDPLARFHAMKEADKAREMQRPGGALRRTFTA